MMFRWKAYKDAAMARILGVNSQSYWDYRFRTDWVSNGGRLQTSLFATGFALLDLKFEPSPESILDFGCGLGDAAPVLAMRFPRAKLFMHDLSKEAGEVARASNAAIAELLEQPDGRKFDLVYCSNVVEHMTDPPALCRLLLSLAKRHVVIQAPYKELHADGTLITPTHRKGEHVQTIDEKLIEGLEGLARWRVVRTRIPVAWEGEQVFFCGELL
jgi:SAM-dependent methyltransferase